MRQQPEERDGHEASARERGERDASQAPCEHRPDGESQHGERGGRGLDHRQHGERDRHGCKADQLRTCQRTVPDPRQLQEAGHDQQGIGQQGTVRWGVGERQVVVGHHRTEDEDDSHEHTHHRSVGARQRYDGRDDARREEQAREDGDPPDVRVVVRGGHRGERAIAEDDVLAEGHVVGDGDVECHPPGSVDAAAWIVRLPGHHEREDRDREDDGIPRDRRQSATKVSRCSVSHPLSGCRP